MAKKKSNKGADKPDTSESNAEKPKPRKKRNPLRSAHTSLGTAIEEIDANEGLDEETKDYISDLISGMRFVLKNMDTDLADGIPAADTIYSQLAELGRSGGRSLKSLNLFGK